MQIDKETRKYCGALLAQIAEEHPVLAQTITKRISSYAELRKPENKELRKLARAAIFCREYPDIYDHAAAKLRGLPEWTSPPSNPKISTFYENIFRLIGITPLPGSVESRYDSGQEPQ